MTDHPRLPPERQAMVTDHLALVGHVVNQISVGLPRHVDRDELWLAGTFGLVEAATRYDPAGGAVFSTYATMRIRGAVIDALRKLDWLPRSVRRQVQEVHEAEQQLTARNGSSPNEADVADALGIDPAELSRRRQAERAGHVDAIDRLGGGRDADDVLDDGEISPEQRLLVRERRAALSLAVHHLPDTHRQVVTRYYYGGELLSAIADDLGLTEVRISQVRLEALQMVRAFFNRHYDGADDGIEPVDVDAPGKRKRNAYLDVMAGVVARQPLLKTTEQQP